MKTRIVRMYCERLEEIMDGIAIECEALTEDENLSFYEKNKLQALKMLYLDLNEIKRVNGFVND